MSPKINNVGFVEGVLTRPKIQKSCNFEFGVFQIMKSGFYYTDLKRINSRKLLKVLFEHIFTIDDPKGTRIIPICVPMILL